jgi:hypothetical protein
MSEVEKAAWAEYPGGAVKSEATGTMHYLTDPREAFAKGAAWQAAQPVILRCCRNGCESEPTSIARDYWDDDLSYSLVPVCAKHAQPRTVSAEQVRAAARVLYEQMADDDETSWIEWGAAPVRVHSLWTGKVRNTLAALGITVAGAGEVR